MHAASSPPRTLWALGAVLLVLAFDDARAAGRFCGDPVESGRASGATQDEALTKAEGWWSSRAGALGRGYERWENARDRAMECGKDDAGAFHCMVTGTPCLPPGVLPENVPKLEM